MYVCLSVCVGSVGLKVVQTDGFRLAAHKKDGRDGGQQLDEGLQRAEKAVSGGSAGDVGGKTGQMCVWMIFFLYWWIEGQGVENVLSQGVE